jgi:hypothetical protein
MPHQVALTIRAKVLPGKVPELKASLDFLGIEANRRQMLPFEQLPVHFARMFILDDAPDLKGVPIPATLVFLSDVDAPLASYVTELCRLAASGLDRAFSCCEGYPSAPTAETRAAYLSAHSLKSAAVYVNTVGRSLVQVRQEAQLRDAIASFVDHHANELAGQSAEAVRTLVADHVRADAGLRWALQPAAQPALSWRLGEALNAVLMTTLAIILLPLTVVALPFYLVLLRLHEIRDKTVRLTATPARLAELAAREDWITQNQFTVVGLRKPGPFRSFTLGVVVTILDQVCRHIFNRGNLAGVRTIHFARWVVIDERRRVLFASNYDGSLESYMDDFIDKVAFGLNAVFSNGVGYPRTNWLFLNGAKDEQAFKDLLRARQLDTPVWYSAYPDLSAVNVANNAAIRAGLTRPLSSGQAAAWAARL